MSSPTEEFVRLLTGGQSRLLAYVFSLLPDREAARNVLQDTNVILWSKADQFVPGSNFLAWACRIAQLEVMAYYRAQRRERVIFDHQLVEQIAPDAQQQAEATDQLSVFLEECLSLRTADEQRLLKDRYAPGGSIKTLAVERGEPENRLSVRLNRLRQTLLECIQRKLAAAGAPLPTEESR